MRESQICTHCKKRLKISPHRIIVDKYPQRIEASNQLERKNENLTKTMQLEKLKERYPYYKTKFNSRTDRSLEQYSKLVSTQNLKIAEYVLKWEHDNKQKISKNLAREILSDPIGFLKQHSMKIGDPYEIKPIKEAFGDINQTEVDFGKDVVVINKWIFDALLLIRSNSDGILESELLQKLSITKNESKKLIPRLLRLDDIFSEDIMHNNIVVDHLLRSNLSNMESNKCEYDQVYNLEKIEKLTKQMVNEHLIDKKLTNKHLRKILTTEYVQLGSISKIVEMHPNMSKKDILRHIITDKRLPPNLKRLENEGALHSNLECSLKIALFATTYFDWDGDVTKENDIINLATSISRYLKSNRELNQVFEESR
jgi:hypothetical protein